MLAYDLLSEATLTLKPEAIIFPTQLIHTASSPVQLQLQAGLADLTVTNMTFTGNQAAQFTLTAPSLPLTVSPNVPVNVDVIFSPTEEGQADAFLTLDWVSSSSSHIPHQSVVALSGKGDVGTPCLRYV